MTLISIFKYNGNKKYMDIAEILLIEEEHYINHSNYSWCNGISAVLLSRCNMLKELDENENLYLIKIKLVYI